jgi:hypothetical protein
MAEIDLAIVTFPADGDADGGDDVDQQSPEDGVSLNIIRFAPTLTETEEEDE